MKDVPSVPAQIVIRHRQKSQARVEGYAKAAEDFRAGLRKLQEEIMTLRTNLEDKPDQLARMEGGYMALQYAAGGVIQALDQVVRYEMVLQDEALRFVQGKPPRIERGRPHLSYEQGSPLANDGRPPKNGPIPAPNGAYGYVKAEGKEVPTNQPDPSVAVGFYLQKDEQGNETRVYVNAYDQVVPPPAEEGKVDHAVSICGVGTTEKKLPAPVTHSGRPVLVDVNAPAVVVQPPLPSLPPNGAPR